MLYNTTVIPWKNEWNRTIKTLSEEARKFNDTSELTQYYAETAAKAAEAPKIVYAYTREIG